jgi:hypothetical protein
MTPLAWTPFLEPINALQSWWYLLLVPLAFGISMIYKALRLAKLDQYWRQVGMMTTQVVLAMVALAIGLAVIIELLIPMIPVQ